jgi:protein phosphatase
MPLVLEPVVRTDVGLVRENNEDAVFASPRVVAVADGVGGHAAGEVASSVVINALVHMEKTRQDGPLDAALAEAVVAGNADLGFVAGRRPDTRGMSTTLTAVALGDVYAIANVGDSRTYLLRDGELTQLTRDDSLVQELVEAGQLTEAAARTHPQRSIVLDALDGGPRTAVGVTTAPAQAGDRLLLCSDGLTDLVDDDALLEALALPREAAADRLVELALAAGGRDNVTVVVADVAHSDDPAAGWP